MRGDVVTSPSGEKVVLADIGLTELYEDFLIRVWDVSLELGETHPWHLHHNPYLVLSLSGSDGRMDWLDGSKPRFVSEYRGGAVYRPVSPVHRLTNIGQTFYRNRLVEFKDLGEHLPEPLDIGPGGRSVEGEPPGVPLSDGRVPVLLHEHVSVWTVTLHPWDSRIFDLTGPHLIVAMDVEEGEPAGGVRVHPGGLLTITNNLPAQRSWFIAELSYLRNLETLLEVQR